MPAADLDDVLRARRVLFYGVTGAGKSTAACRFGQLRGLPVVLVDDDIGWLPAAEAVWTNRGVGEQRELAERLTAGAEWVLDSAYGTFRDIVLARADVMVALDYPRWFSLARLVRRTLHRGVSKQTVCNGNVESWRNAVGRDSILRWHFRSYRHKTDRMRALEAADDGLPVLRLTSPRQLDALFGRLGAVAR